MKNEVYSWRVDAEVKGALEDEAGRLGLSLAEALDRAVRAWLEEQRSVDDEAAQERRQAAARSCFGAIAGGDPGRSVRARGSVRARLGQRRGR